MKAQVLMTVSVAMYIEADNQREAEERAAAIAAKFGGQKYQLTATGERHSFVTDSAEVTDVDMVTP